MTPKKATALSQIRLVIEGNKLSPLCTAQVGTMIFGKYWMNRMALAMGVSRATPQQWAKNGMPIRQFKKLCGLVLAKSQLIQCEIMYLNHLIVNGSSPVSPPKNELREAFSEIVSNLDFGDG